MRTAEQPAASAPAAEPQPYIIVKRAMTRWWEVRDPAGELVCLTVYRRGAREVVRRLKLVARRTRKASRSAAAAWDGAAAG